MLHLCEPIPHQNQVTEAQFARQMFHSVSPRKKVSRSKKVVCVLQTTEIDAQSIYEGCTKMGRSSQIAQSMTSPLLFVNNIVEVSCLKLSAIISVYALTMVGKLLHNRRKCQSTNLRRSTCFGTPYVFVTRVVLRRERELVSWERGFAGCPAVGQVKKVGKVGHFWQKVGQK